MTFLMEWRSEVCCVFFLLGSLGVGRRSTFECNLRINKPLFSTSADDNDDNLYDLQLSSLA